ncbi:hypothetical protein FAIPA1_130028 [Frankia sp. AiPs1]
MRFTTNRVDQVRFRIRAGGIAGRPTGNSVGGGHPELSL